MNGQGLLLLASVSIWLVWIVGLVGESVAEWRRDQASAASRTARRTAAFPSMRGTLTMPSWPRTDLDEVVEMDGRECLIRPYVDNWQHRQPRLDPLAEQVVNQARHAMRELVTDASCGQP